MTPQQHDVHGAELLSAMADLMARLPSENEELRAQAASLADQLSSYVGAARTATRSEDDPVEHEPRHDVSDAEHDEIDELRAQAQVRTAFLIALSHDLRAPIGALVHQGQLLTADGLDADLRRRSIETLQENARILAQMMEDLVDIERYAQGELHLDLTVTTLASILEAVDGDDIGVLVRPDEADATASVDLDVMARAIRSMINATRRRSPSSLVHVTGAVTDRFIEIAVRDKTSQIDPSRPSMATRTVETRLTTALVEAHGGSVSTAEHGLVLRLPRLTAATVQR